MIQHHHMPRYRVSRLAKQISILTIAAVGIYGCTQEAPPQAAIPADVTYVPHQAPPKPLPDSALNPPGATSPGPYQDADIVQQPLPEQAEFLAAYAKVHQPRIAIYVNRTLQGQIIPPNPGGPVESTEHTQTSTGSVTVGGGSYDEHADAYGRDVQSNHSNFSSNGPATYTETNTHYLAPGEYDEAKANTLDYQAMEKILSDWLSCGGQVHLISSDYLAAQLSPEEMAALQEGKPIVMSDMAQKVGADVLIQVQAHPTNQTGALQVRLVAEAMNIRGGDQIGTAVVDVPLPLDKPQLNDYTRFIAAKLMVGMRGAWESYAANPPPPQQPGQAPPAAPPAATPVPQGNALPPVPPAAVAPAPQAAAPASQPTNTIDMIP